MRSNLASFFGRGPFYIFLYAWYPCFYVFYVPWNLSPHKVEKDKNCQKLLMKRYPDECLFGDIFDLIHLRGGKPSSTKLIDPHKISFKKKAPCLTHGKLCPVPDFESMLALLGAPCVLFSRLLDNQSLDNW